MNKKASTSPALNPLDVLHEGIAASLSVAIRKVYKSKETVASSFFTTPPNSAMGDIAIPCFTLSKPLKTPPPAIAAALADALNAMLVESNAFSYAEDASTTSGAPISLFSRFEAAGPYLNVFLDPRGVAKLVLESATNPRYGMRSLKKKHRIVLEFVSPNTNKPLHLGHVRNGFLGESLARILETNGNEVHRTAVINDRGIHICKSMIAYMEKGVTADGTLPTPESTHTKGDHFVGDYYVAFEKQAKKDESWNELAQSCLRQWEEEDPKVRALWKAMNEWTLAGHEETYARLGIRFDSFILESDIFASGRKMILDGLKKKIFKKDAAGNIIAPLEKKGMPDKIVLRADGTTVYATQDIALAVTRQKELKADETLYVIMNEQNLYLKQLFAILSLMKYSWAKTLQHVSYGMVHLPEGRMKSREGTSVDADNLLDGLEDLAIKEIAARYDTLSREEIEERAQKVAFAALAYYMLEVSPSSDILYNPKESLSFQGRTGPYLLYTYARIRSIVRKGGAVREAVDFGGYDWEEEKSVVTSLATFPSVVFRAGEDRSPAVIARFLFDLAQTLNDYYHRTPVLQASPTERAARLALLDTASAVLKQGLSLLCITPLEHM